MWLFWTTLGRVGQWSFLLRRVLRVYGAPRRFPNGFNASYGSYKLSKTPTSEPPPNFCPSGSPLLTNGFQSLLGLPCHRSLLLPKAVTTGTSYSLPAYVVHSRMVERMDRDHKRCAKLIHLISYKQLLRKFDRLDEV